MKNLPLRKLATTIFLLGGLAAAVVLVQKEQDIREKAAGPQVSDVALHIDCKVPGLADTCLIAASAVDTSGQLILNAPPDISYSWGISTTATTSARLTLFNTHGPVTGYKIAETGSGDIWVIARNVNSGPSVYKGFRVENGNPVFESPAQETDEPKLIPGDLDRNGKVDVFDYELLVSHFGSNMPSGGTPADIDGDADVDIFDYNLLVSNFGKKAQAGRCPSMPKCGPGEVLLWGDPFPGSGECPFYQCITEPPSSCAKKEWVRTNGTRPTATTTNCNLVLFSESSCKGKVLGYGYCKPCSGDGSGVCMELFSPTSFTFRSADLQYGQTRWSPNSCTDPGWEQTGGGVFSAQAGHDSLVWGCAR